MLLATSFALSAQDWPNCGSSGCVSGDLVVDSVYVDAMPCSGATRSGVLKADLSTGATRYNVRITAQVYVISSGAPAYLETVDVCLDDFTGTQTVVLDANISWACDTSLELRYTLVSWQILAGNFPCSATLPCANITPKCNGAYYNQQIPVAGSEPPNTPPTGNASTVTANEDTAYPFAVSDFGYTDPESDPLAQIRITGLETVGDLLLSGSPVSLNAVVTAAQLNAGALTFEPLPNGNGSPYDSFDFLVHDGTVYASASATMTIHVTAVNDPPTGSASTVTANEDTAYTFAVGDFGYTDPESDPLVQIRITGLETVGDLLVSGSPASLNEVVTAAQLNAGALTFEPLPDESGSPYDSFQFQVHDGTDYAPSSATMTIHITAVNDPPVAVADDAITQRNESVFIAVLANDTDPEGGILVLASATDPAHGSLDLGGGLIRYTPDFLYTGPDTFTYTIQDPAEASATGLVSVTVENPNRPPIANANGTYEGLVGDPIELDARFSNDPDIADALQYRWDLTGDGTWDTGWLTSATTEVVFDRPYRGMVTLEVRDLYLGSPNGTFDQDAAFAFIAPRPTQIAVTLFIDLNGDGEFNEGDAGLSEIPLLLDGETLIWTDETGVALFEEIEPGTHSVGFPEAAIAALADRGLVLEDPSQQAIVEAGEWAAVFFTPEARGFLQVDLGRGADRDGE